MQLGKVAEQCATLAVGVVLMIIGGMGLKESREWDEGVPEEAESAFSWRTFGTGMLSGMHPDALLLCLPALALPTRSAGLIFLTSFGAGSMLAMGGYSAALRAACKSLGEQAVRRTSSIASALAIGLGMLRWYKHEFFTWTNAPRCDFCRSTDTKTIGGTEPTPEEQHFLAFKVEVAKCNACGQQTRFPRYNDPAKLLETRTGRCGEWANCFTLLCRALGYEARHVHDWTDHVWTEVFSDSEQRWIHLDSCEAAFDSPLMYEKGWGKKLTYCIGFARDHVTDVTRRYTQKFEELLTRRTACTEQDLSRTVAALSEFALDRSVSQLPAAAAEARRAQLASRGAAEQTQLAAAQSGAKAEEEVGRTSGDAAWREQRGELGANSAAKQKALACSELGVEGAAAPASKPAEPKAPASTPAAPKAPAEGHSSQEAQARMRARIAQFVAEGMTANEALLKVIQEAKMTNA
ncbi:unnamed protein product [Effrenium voratum]|uniref:Transglutaminase-like domain-containing protein n=1 Tax=Effrenium voratum TaxID=2562239 RepID=A0AA36NJZ4_9DINO|nr:unnamed protein product [Effrenium voratum]